MNFPCLACHTVELADLHGNSSPMPVATAVRRIIKSRIFAYDCPFFGVFSKTPFDSLLLIKSPLTRKEVLTFDP